MVAEFVPGIELARRLHRDVVGPLLADALDGRPYAAALLGPGSEVLGFDTVRSTDHDWGPRLHVFLDPTDAGRAAELTEWLGRRLPSAVAGHATAIRWDDGHLGHGVQLVELGGWLVRRLGADPRTGFGTADWLATPTQALAEVTGGAVFHDPRGELAAIRAALSWYPPDVWRYALAGLWSRIAEEEPFVGRAGEVGDELGSTVVAARLVRDLMRICLLLHRRYPPYAKWLGSAFARLPCGPALTPVLTAALGATDRWDREARLGQAYRAVAELQNAAGLCTPVDPTLRRFYSRPFWVLRAGRFAEALLAAVTDPELADRPAVGAVDCYLDSTVLLTDPARVRALAAAVHAPGRMG
jgi:hypothetical protein